MAQTITAQRFGQLLRQDLYFIIEFILGNNFNAVADKFDALSITRPYNEDGAWQGLNYLLNNGRGNDFVEALNVPLNVDHLSPDQIVQLYAAAGGNADASTAARGLAINALGLYDALPAGEADPDTTTKRVEPPETAAPPTVPQAAEGVAKRRKVMGLVFVWLLATLVIITTTLLIRTTCKA